MNIEKIEPQIIAFASGKGGSGKTIIVANLAYALSKINQTVLLIDCDFSTRGLTFFITKGLTDFEPHNCLLEYLKGEVKPDEVTPLKISDNIHLLAATRAIKESVTFDRAELPNCHEKLSKLLANIKNEYSMILIDVQSGTDFKSIFPCLSADLFVLVTEEDRTSFRVTSVINNLIQESQESYKIPVKKGAFILNRCVKEQSEEVISFLETRLLQCKYVSTILYEPKVKQAFLLDDFVIEKYPESDFSIKICEIIGILFKRSESIQNVISNLKNEFAEKRATSLKIERRPIIRIKTLTFTVMYLILLLLILDTFYGNIQNNIFRIFILILLGTLGLLVFEFLKISEKRN